VMAITKWSIQAPPSKKSPASWRGGLRVAVQRVQQGVGSRSTMVQLCKV
jgi:hypothetical protein